MNQLPSRIAVRDSFRGFGRAAQIRTLYAERCSLSEIAAALGVGDAEIRRSLNRPPARHHNLKTERAPW